MYSWTRPTVPWSLECEALGKTREKGFKVFQVDLIVNEGAGTVSTTGYVIDVIVGMIFAGCSIAIFFCCFTKQLQSTPLVACIQFIVTKIVLFIALPTLFAAVYPMRVRVKENIEQI